MPVDFQPTLVPIVLGQTQDSAQKKASSGRAALPKRAWDEATIMAEIEARSTPAAVTAAATILARIRRRADRVAFNSNPVWGWVGAVFEKDGFEIPLVRLHTDGSVAVYFEIGISTNPTPEALAGREGVELRAAVK